jgi:hypothetical protein
VNLDPISIWVGAIATLAVFSFMAKDNIFYRVVQHAALGATVGTAIVITWQQVLDPMWWQAIRGGLADPGVPAWLKGMANGVGMDLSSIAKPLHWSQSLWVLAIVPGGLWYFQLSKKYFWVSTLVSGLFIGVAAGLAFKGTMNFILPQINSSFKGLNPWTMPGGFQWDGTFLAALSNLVFVVGLLTSIMYFFFSVKTDNVLMKPPMLIGRWMIMICLGSMFAATVMTRIAYLLDRLQFLYNDWLQGIVFRWFQ